jgi:hypothetical protein
MSRVEYQTVLFTRDCITDEDLNNFGYDGWKLSTLVPLESNPFAIMGVLYREVVEEDLNAKIRNKLGPIQTLLDLCKIQREGKATPKIDKLMGDTLDEVEKSIEFLTHIGE